jgi:periplasmic divalent cation tolerance protein
MIPPVPCVMAFVTAPDIETARKIVRIALEKGLTACANIIPLIESHYWWQEKIESSSEVLIIFKTTIHRQFELRECVLANHPYEVPEFVVLNIDQGSDAYLQWIRQNAIPRQVP